MTRILYLADGASVHTRKWIRALTDQDYVIHLFSLNRFNPADYGDKNNGFSYEEYSVTKNREILGGINKLNYLPMLKVLKKAIEKFRPDILHAHFASSYGRLAARSGFHPTIISVWGSDVFHFPRRSCIHKQILKMNLQAADRILSTSEVMAKETGRYTPKRVEVTPFGVDTDIFYPHKESTKKNYSQMYKDGFIIGTAKSLENKYAIDDLIEAFILLNNKYPLEKMQLVIAGKGSAESQLKDLVYKKGIKDRVMFIGQIDHREIPGFYNAIDVFAALSLEESFGVAVIEASACAKPVVVSDAGGLPEVVEKDITGYIVPRRDPQAAADALERLFLNRSLRTHMGKAGRERVIKMYEWKQSVRQMLNIYQTLLTEANR
ncbi:MAG: glycosyltransferase [Candidatus Marinimicrobia bacterium]|jgi:glycosyltransferase involved in cell wall biosynthesis|nr:glycosyltransferase [Candidatus Neomarinimicrobiota bacterium]MDD4961194.1 glycosyltransferase [Candidatus Neomarinimicrobiota bacterium]MDD5710270.1 glycosyltransferase [Candidatus Neomarinimicrobiota bacterium]MDX9777822.1 glycosyltransferase [bacterium]